MNIYDKFASVYAEGGYTRYSSQMAEMLPGLLKRFNAAPASILDLACGTGTFAVLMANQGFKVAGIDLSPQMIAAAKKQAAKAGARVKFSVKDVRSLDAVSKYDLVTCWFDSLNYLLRNEDLTQTFKAVARALTDDGLFVFDMNTIYGIAFAYWRLSPYRVDNEDLLMLHRFTDYDHDLNIMRMKLTWFVREGEAWKRFDEVHQERAYTLTEIRASLKEAGLTEEACWGNPSAMIEPRRENPRVWFVARKA